MHFTRSKTILLVVSAAILAVACGGSPQEMKAAGADAGTDYTGPCIPAWCASGHGGAAGVGDYGGVAGAGRGARDAAVPAPFSNELAGLVTQPVRWALLDVSVTGARVARGLDKNAGSSQSPLSGLGFPGLTLSPSEIYVELNLALENKGSREVDSTSTNTWDVVLADGRRLTSIDGLGVSMLPGDKTKTSLHYRVDEVVPLAGAKLVLNGDDRTSVEPEEIPLDAAYVQQFPRRIGSIAGHESRFVDTSNHTASVHFDEAVYDVNYARQGRTKRDSRIVWLDAAFTSTKLQVAGYTTHDLRIVVDGRASVPFDWGTGTIESGATRVFRLGFNLPKTATHFEIVVPDGSAQGTRFPVDVADTVLATDIP